MNAQSRGSAPIRLPEPIFRAIEEMRAHEAVRGVGSISTGDGGKLVFVEGEFDVPLPSRLLQAGVSATGVRASEPVTFAFSSAYPFQAPCIWLRNDFPRTFAHINPSTSATLVVPCIADIPIAELLHEGLGFPRVLDEVARWLASAAAGTLNDQSQGWQPMRRDFIVGHVSFPTRPIVESIGVKGGYLMRATLLFAIGDNVHATIHPDASLDGSAKAANYLLRLEDDGDVYCRTAAVIAWGNATDKSGQPRADAEYFPDTVENLDGLLVLAERYQIQSALSKGLDECCRAFAKLEPGARPSHVVVVLCARRPFNLIGSDYPIECLPYAVTMELQGGRLPGTTRVQPLNHREGLSSEFLRHLSGGGMAQSPGPIVMLGAGSLGSKITMHLARAGLGPFTIVDNGRVHPHHLARHAVSELPDHRELHKALQLKKMIRPFTPASTAHSADIVQILSSESSRAEILPKFARIAIETTGSLAVREYLAQLPARAIPRLAHGVLYDSGNVALLAVEGDKRNPRVDDLVASFHQQSLTDADLSARMAASASGMKRVAIGHGCGSYSMVLPDSRLSVAAGGMAERLRELIESTIPDNGLVLVGRSSADHLGYSWTENSLGKTEDFAAEDRSPWRVRILRSVVTQMTEDAEKFGRNETGGGVVGRLYFLRRCITITGLIPAPPDSVRKDNEFILGVEGLREEANAISSRSGGQITYLGTWHSHPLGGKPSPKDYKTFERIKTLRSGVPGIVLVWTPHRFFAIAG